MYVGTHSCLETEVGEAGVAKTAIGNRAKALVLRYKDEAKAAVFPKVCPYSCVLKFLSTSF